MIESQDSAKKKRSLWHCFQFIRIFAADNVERFADLMLPDSLQPHKKMLKVTLF
jgi:hypothetical protein